MPTATVEDYVKAIYHAQQSLAAGGKGPRGRALPGSVALGDLATSMSVVPGTATAMVKTLAKAGLVKYELRKGVRLSAAGEKLALHVLRRHRLIELFLVRVLKIDWSEVHEEAEALEHALSDKVVNRIDELLGFPEADPHGDPIPTTAGKLSTERSRPLSACHPGETARIIRLENRDPAFLRYAEKQGLLPGVRIKVTKVEPEAGAHTVEVKGKPMTMGEPAAARIWVSV